MTLQQIFIQNLKEFRKREKFTQEKMSERCGISQNYLAEIESGRKFPSIEIIEKMADVLKINAYHLFMNRIAAGSVSDSSNTYCPMPNSVKNEIVSEVNSSINLILEKY